MMPGMPALPAGRRHLGLGEAVAVGRDGAEPRLRALADHVEVDAVQVVARLLGGDGELRAVDQPLQHLGGEREGDRQLAGIQIGKIGIGQHLQREARAAGLQRHGLSRARIERDLGAVGQLAHDVVEHVGGDGAGARLLDRGRHAVDDLHVEVGRLQRELVAIGAQQHVGQDRDGVAPLDDAMDVVERLQEVRPFDSDAHDFNPWGRVPEALADPAELA